VFFFRLFAMLEAALLANPQKLGGQPHHLGCFQVNISCLLAKISLLKNSYPFSGFI
jgi:hypothetical protein